MCANSLELSDRDIETERDKEEDIETERWNIENMSYVGRLLAYALVLNQVTNILTKFKNFFNC